MRTLAPLEATLAGRGPPQPLPGMEDVEARFAHLLQPIRDLTKNWEVDVAAQLGEYLEEVRAAGGVALGGRGAGPGAPGGPPPPGLCIRRSGRAWPRARLLFPAPSPPPGTIPC